MLKLLRLLLIIATGCLLFASIEPYIELVKLIFGTAGAEKVCGTIGGIWFIGRYMEWGCNAIGSIIGGLAGVLLWAIFQSIELLPIATYFHVPFISGIVQKFQNAPQVEVKTDDRESLVKIKKRHNTVTERSLGVLISFSWVVYIVDFLLMSWLYSPLDVNGDINWAGLARVLLSVAGVELLVLAIVLLNNVIDPASVRYQSTKYQREVKEY